MKENINTTTEYSASENKDASKRKSSSAVKIIKTVATVILLIIVAFLSVVTVKLAYDKFIAKKTVPSFLGYSILWVDTGSMAPTIKEDDLIIIKNTGDYWTGDIITFIHPGETVPTTHRIIEFADETKELYITRGDGNKGSVDKLPVSKDQVFGEVVCVMHGLGMFVSWTVKGGGFIFILAALMIIGVTVYLLMDNTRTVNLGEEAKSEDAPAPAADKKPEETASPEKKDEADEGGQK